MTRKNLRSRDRNHGRDSAWGHDGGQSGTRQHGDANGVRVEKRSVRSKSLWELVAYDEIHLALGPKKLDKITEQK